MNAGIRFSSILGCLVAVFICPGCDGEATTVSDVPCFRPTDWDFSSPLVRVAEEGSDVLLFTGQTMEQFLADFDDGMNDFQPHSAVYRLDPEVGSFVLVDDRVWDNADGEVISCGGILLESPLRVEGFFSPRLVHNGSNVAVAGGNPLRVVSSPTRAVAAVLSSAGFTPGGVFAGTAIGTGQHFHQFFSEIDGSPFGDPVRVGVGNARVEGCWTAQEDYVIYRQSTGEGESRTFTLCAVPVTEDLPPLEGE